MFRCDFGLEISLIQPKIDCAHCRDMKSSFGSSRSQSDICLVWSGETNDLQIMTDQTFMCRAEGLGLLVYTHVFTDVQFLCSRSQQKVQQLQGIVGSSNGRQSASAIFKVSILHSSSGMTPSIIVKATEKVVSLIRSATYGQNQSKCTVR